MPAMTREPAYAKVNLFLEVLGRLPNGYHHLHSLMVFSDVGEWVSVSLSSQPSFNIVGSEARALQKLSGDNLVLKAAAAYNAALGVGTAYDIVLHKTMPVASGIGGGSADAAAALRSLNALHGGPFGEQAMLDIAAALGADVPVCLLSEPALLNGVGAELSAARVSGFSEAVLVNPRKGVPTPEVFGAFAANPFEQAPEAGARAWTLADVQSRRNDLTQAALSLCPEIADVLAALNALPGAVFARMSGSGATCFALFHDAAGADQAIEMLAGQAPGWWCQRASFRSILAL